jgi:hypothetical protein
VPRGAARRRDRRQRQTANAAGVRVALSGNPAGCSTWLRRLFTGDLVCRPNSQLKSDEVVRHGRRIGRVGADDDGNLCVVRRSVLEHSSKSKHFCVTRAGLARESAARASSHRLAQGRDAASGWDGTRNEFIVALPTAATSQPTIAPYRGHYRHNPRRPRRPQRETHPLVAPHPAAQATPSPWHCRCRCCCCWGQLSRVGLRCIPTMSLSRSRVRHHPHAPTAVAERRKPTAGSALAKGTPSNSSPIAGWSVFSLLLLRFPPAVVSRAKGSVR